MTAAEVVRALHAAASPGELEKVRRRLGPGEPAIGLRMRDLFEIAKGARGMSAGEVEALLREPAYEARMAAFAILDFQARGRLGDPALLDVYLRNHDRITTWDMVDRAAPRVVGAAVAGGPYDVLHELAEHPEPLRRRTAITAPLWFTKTGEHDDLVAGFAIAARLAADPEPAVAQAVGIYAGHAAKREPALRDAFLAAHGASLPAAARRVASR